MKKILLSCFVIMLFGLTACERGGLPVDKPSAKKAGKANIKIDGAQLNFSQLEYDFGQIKPSDKVSHDFKFKNDGNALLKILNVRSSCGCTTTKMDKREYAPGETGVITAKFDPKNFQGDQVKTITIKSNDPLRETIVLKIKAHVLVEILVRPTRLYYRDMIVGQPRATTISLQGAEVKHFNIKDIIVSKEADYIITALEKLNDNSRSAYHLRVDCVPNENTPQNFSGVITVVTDSKEKPTLNIPFRGNVKGNVNYAPQSLGQNFNTPIYFNRTIQFTSNIPFKIQDVYFQNKAVTLKHKLLTLSPGHSYSIVVFSDDKIDATVRNTLIVKTDSKMQPEIRIPVSLIKK